MTLSCSRPRIGDEGHAFVTPAGAYPSSRSPMLVCSWLNRVLQRRLGHGNRALSCWSVTGPWRGCSTTAASARAAAPPPVVCGDHHLKPCAPAAARPWGPRWPRPEAALRCPEPSRRPLDGFARHVVTANPAGKTGLQLWGALQQSGHGSAPGGHDPLLQPGGCRVQSQGQNARAQGNGATAKRSCSAAVCCGAAGGRPSLRCPSSSIQTRIRSRPPLVCSRR